MHSAYRIILQQTMKGLMMSYPYTAYIKGTSEYPPAELERRLNIVLTKALVTKGLNEIESIRVTEPFSERDTAPSFAVVWGYIENYLGPGEWLNANRVVAAVQVGKSTVKKALEKLVNLGIVTGGPLEYQKSSEPDRGLENYLEEFPLWRGSRWVPKVMTYGPDRVSELKVPYISSVRGKAVVVERAQVVRLNSSIIDILAKTGEVMPTKLLAEMVGVNRSTAHRTLTKLLAKGLVELTRDKRGTNQWNITEKYFELKGQDSVA